MNVLIFGGSSGIGYEVSTILSGYGHNVFAPPRGMVNLDSDSACSRIHEIIDWFDPDIIVNSAGYLTDNIEDSRTTTRVNLESNWSIINYYVKNARPKPVTIVMVGSSAYREGKKQYMMYSATKAAVHNLWEGARDYFRETNITVSVIHPVRTRTPMATKRFSPDLDYLEPLAVAREIVKLTESSESQCIKLTFEEKYD